VVHRPRQRAAGQPDEEATRASIHVPSAGRGRGDEQPGRAGAAASGGCVQAGRLQPDGPACVAPCSAGKSPGNSEATRGTPVDYLTGVLLAKNGQFPLPFGRLPPVAQPA